RRTSSYPWRIRGGRSHAPGEAPLQVQVRRLFRLLAAAQGGQTTGDELLNTSLAAYFVPFRSPQIRALAHRRESLAFATKLWTEILDYCTPRLIITIDQRTTRCLLGILNGTRSRRQFEVGWGTFSADVFAYSSVT